MPSRKRAITERNACTRRLVNITAHLQLAGKKRGRPQSSGLDDGDAALRHFSR